MQVSSIPTPAKPFHTFGVLTFGCTITRQSNTHGSRLAGGINTTTVAMRASLGKHSKSRGYVDFAKFGVEPSELTSSWSEQWSATKIVSPAWT